MTSQATMAFKSSSHAHWMAASGQWKEVEKNLENVGYTSLQSILTVFDSGINEEQAWAICYQAARSLSKIWAASKVGSVLFLFVPFALFSLFFFLLFFFFFFSFPSIFFISMTIQGPSGPP